MNTTLQPIPELDNLPEDKLDQLHAWLEKLSIRKTMARLKDEWSLSITYNKLCRYRARHFTVSQLSEHQDHALAMPEYLALLNGQPVPYDQAGLALVQKRAFDLAHAPNISVAKLATLQRVFHYHTARADAERRLAQADQRIKQTDRRNDLAESALKLREQELADRRAARAKANSKTVNSDSEQSDDLGPFARDWDEIGERARIAFDVSKEEWARRQALHETYVDPYPELNDPNPGPIPGLDSNPTLDPNPVACPAQHSIPAHEADEPSIPGTQHSPDAQQHVPSPSPFPSVSSMTPSLNPSVDLASSVNAYNIRRAQEYWTWRRHIASLRDGEPHPQFITQHRHCPCGQVPAGTPCPEHENETHGEFPSWFWTVSPHLIAYARCLTDRNLPYRDPAECIPTGFFP